MSEEPHAPDESVDATDDVVGGEAEIVEERDVVDTNVDRFIDRMVYGDAGTVTGNAMIGMAKGMGLHKPVEEAAEIREGDEPEPDPDDPIQIHIDPDHPENTRIVYRVPRAGGADPD